MIREKKKENNKQELASLTGKMWTVITMLSLVCVIAFLVFTDLESKRTEKVNAEETIRSISDSIQSEMKTYEDISRLIMIQSDVVKYLRYPISDPDLKYNARLGIMDVLNACRYIDSVFVIRNDGNYVSTGRGNYSLSPKVRQIDNWPKSIVDGRGKAISLINAENMIYREDGETLITIARVIYDIDSQKQTGLLLMNISPKTLFHLEEASLSKVCICSEDGIPLAGDSEILKEINPDYFSKKISHQSLGAKGDIVSGIKMGDIPLVIMARSKADIKDVPTDIILITALALLVFIISFFIMGAFLTKSITKPVRVFSEGIEKANSEGKLQKISASMPDNEIGMLKDTYNSMIDHINELIAKQRDHEKEMQRTEIRILQEQIKPHFLYNALGTIGGIAIEEGSENVRNAVETLGNFYKNFLSNGDREIELRTEITIIQNYITMQKLRYGDILKDEYEIETKTLKCLIPKLILQPLVENSINYGARLKGEIVRIRIKAWERDGYVHLLVYDSGLGMSGDTIQKILKKQRSSRKESGGFGLKETVTRISYYNKEKDAIQIRSEEGEYTEIEIKLPYKLSKGEDVNV